MDSLRRGHGSEPTRPPLPEPPTRLIAFYLPQFHPIPENDAWWGTGFTEWTNVTKAKPMFNGHYQPRLPSDLGFYDLRVPETRIAQAKLAAEYGISAFCYWHYWFAGRRILERPFREVLRSGEPKLPFCLAWANQTWSGIWHGEPQRILIEQTYPGRADHEAHFRWLLEAFGDDRYVTVEGKPLFVVFRPRTVPDLKRTADLWRELAHQAGLPGLYLVGDAPIWWNPGDHGLDASFTADLPPVSEPTSWRVPRERFRWEYKRWRRLPTIYRYRDIHMDYVKEASSPIENHPCVLPGWDNTPRSGSNGLVLHDSRPKWFREQLTKAMRLAHEHPIERRIIFVKSWNEWAEGNYLEPDRRYGRQYLEVVREELSSSLLSKLMPQNSKEVPQ
jgi:hypothetical protein